MYKERFLWNCFANSKNNILEFNKYVKSDKVLNIIYGDIEYLIKKYITVKIIQKNCQQKKGKHIPCQYSMSTIWAFDQVENKHSLHRGKDCMKKFCESLRGHAKNITDFEKKKMLSLTKKELKSHQHAMECFICRKEIHKKVCKR